MRFARHSSRLDRFESAGEQAEHCQGRPGIATVTDMAVASELGIGLSPTTSRTTMTARTFRSAAMTLTA
jgi:hypothetical protein